MAFFVDAVPRAQQRPRPGHAAARKVQSSGGYRPRLRTQGRPASMPAAKRQPLSTNGTATGRSQLPVAELTVPVQRTYPLADVPRALADFAAGSRGKLAVGVA